MSYNFEDYFADNLAPELKKLFTKTEVSAETFINIIKKSLYNYNCERFKSVFLNAIINPSNDDLSIERTIKDIFQILNDYNDMELRKIEYSDGDTIISINYHGVSEEEELRSQTAEKIAKTFSPK